MESEIGQERLRDVLDDLVKTGDLTQAQAALVESAYGEVQGTGPNLKATPRKWLGELGGYIGGAFTLTAGFILLGRTWSSINQAGKIGVLGALAAILFGAGVLIYGMRPGVSSRQLAGTLVSFGAISAAGAGGNGAPHHHELLIASLVGFLVGLLGYWRVRSASSHIALFGFFALLVVSLFDSAHLQRGVLSLVMFAVGASWLSLAYRNLLTEKVLGLTLAMAAMVFAGEFAFLDGSRGISYAILAMTAVVGFRIYVTNGLWPPLAGAVSATTLGVGQIVGTTLGGALGAALGLLAAGLALLALSAWVLRRRK